MRLARENEEAAEKIRELELIAERERLEAVEAAAKAEKERIEAEEAESERTR